MSQVLDTHIRKLPSNIPSLKYIPEYIEGSIPYCNVFGENYNDTIPKVPQEFSICNRRVVAKCILTINPNSILEIGVQRNELRKSSTGTIFNNKSKSCIYLGVDIESKTHLNNTSENIHTLQIDSSDYDKVVAHLKKLNVTSLDMILIDGDHSIEQVIKDWKYTNILRVGGCVLMHDTNGHWGPYYIFDSVDEAQYTKIKHCDPTNGHGIKNDWGIGVLIKISE